MTVAPAGPRAQALDEAFAGAMGAAPKPTEPPAPPEVDREAPHGRDENGEPLAPYGKTKDGRPKLSPAGRKPNVDDKARLAKDSPDAKGQGTQRQLGPHDFSGPPKEAGATTWVGGSLVARPGPPTAPVGP